jgi:hypothetical protein
LDHTSFRPRLGTLPIVTSAVREKPANDNARPWRCRACGALLGVARGGELQVKYKDTEVWFIGGTCRRTCRRCGERNEVTVGASPGTEGK